MFLEELKKHIVKQVSVIYDIDEAAAIAHELLLFYTGVSSFTLGADKTSISLIQQSKIEAAIIRLCKHEPLQYILGEAWFYNLPFFVNNYVLIPRPETEELVALIVNEQQNFNIEQPTFSILDIGTGSGCIPIVLKKNIPHAQVYAMDISAEALTTAKQNAERHNVVVEFFDGDILTSNFQLPVSTFDIIVSNPPYITEVEKEDMNKNVLTHEPHLALFVTDGNPLQFYEAIADFAAQNLVNNGLLYLEINKHYGEEVKQCLKGYGFQQLSVIADMSGNHRMIKGILIRE